MAFREEETSSYIASFKLPLQPLMRPRQSPTYSFSGGFQVLGVQPQCPYSWQNLA